MIKKMVSILLVMSMLLPTLAFANTQEVVTEQSSNVTTLTQEDMQMLFDNPALSNNDQQTLQIALLSDTQLKETEGAKGWKWWKKHRYHVMVAVVVGVVVMTGGSGVVVVASW